MAIIIGIGNYIGNKLNKSKKSNFTFIVSLNEDDDYISITTNIIVSSDDETLNLTNTNISAYEKNETLFITT